MIMLSKYGKDSSCPLKKGDSPFLMPLPFCRGSQADMAAMEEGGQVGQQDMMDEPQYGQQQYGGAPQYGGGQQFH